MLHVICIIFTLSVFPFAEFEGETVSEIWRLKKCKVIIFWGCYFGSL